uniref:Thioredoxin domain-containing protein n=1 Tax=Aegilops tauschii TaxID=37682 RepID=M8BPL9_AEGTA
MRGRICGFSDTKISNGIHQTRMSRDSCVVFASIQERDPEVLQGKGDILKPKEEEELASGEKPGEEDGEQKTVVEEEDPSWPLDADVGWGVRASEYFDKHSIKNVTVDGVEIDWEGEVDRGWVKEINCLEWESFAFHPSPLIVLVFERYNRAADNWRFLQELEKATKVYWDTKDRLPPRTVKIDLNIERDLAYALQAKECPQLLFLRGNKILYREKDAKEDILDAYSGKGTEKNRLDGLCQARKKHRIKSAYSAFWFEQSSPQISKIMSNWLFQVTRRNIEVLENYMKKQSSQLVPTGLEPVTFGISDQHSNQLSYRTLFLTTK